MVLSILLRPRSWGDFRLFRKANRSLDVDLSSAESVEDIKSRMQSCIVAAGGEVNARKNAISLGSIYINLSDAGKCVFLSMLSTDFGYDVGLVESAFSACSVSDINRSNTAVLRKLSRSLDSKRMKILKQFLSLDSGLKFLVDMQADVLRFSGALPNLKDLSDDLHEILSYWFDVGMLDIESITWDSPASLLEKLIRYEAVHAITSWGDLRNRLESDRRCFAFFHFKMPNEPIIFVEVAITNGIAGSIQGLLDESQPTADVGDCDSAIFYSISNAQKGLRNISLGNFLIKTAVERLCHDMPHIKNFVTLSPIPGFCSWLKTYKMDDALMADVAKRLVPIVGAKSNKGDILAIMEGSWYKDESLVKALREPLMKLCAQYLIKEQNSKNKAIDPVANFHLRNGASVMRINWMADVSEKGFAQSACIMVNYLYVLDDIDDNHENYAKSGIIKCSKEVLRMLG